VTLKLGTRGSDLALAQARWTAAALEAAGAKVELVVISTAGDRSQAPSFGSIGPQGVFVKEIEEQLEAGTIDLAVHSFKDLPTRSPAGLVVAAVPPRVDPADYLLVHPDAYDDRVGGPLPLAAGSTIGTSSARRQAWLRFLRDDIAVAPLRGNVPTRIGRARARDYDAIVLAHAGIERLAASLADFAATLDGVRLVRLDPAEFVPAPAQGALALQCRRADDATRMLLARLDDRASRLAVTAERELLARAEGGCDAAFGAYCRKTRGGFELVAMAETNGRIRRSTAAGPEPAPLVPAAWEALAASRFVAR
jgi:hydroxymethylbilane synthase